MVRSPYDMKRRYFDGSLGREDVKDKRDKTSSKHEENNDEIKVLKGIGR